MNKIITQHVLLRGKLVTVDKLSKNSSIKVNVECSHGQRSVKWCRRHQLCRKCVSQAGKYNTSKKGRQITWGDKISKSKKGVKFSEEHKNSLIEVRKIKFCNRVNIPIDEFTEFPSYSAGRFNLAYAVRQGIVNNWQQSQIRLDQKYKEIFSLLGYDLIVLKTHLESKFQPGMTWENYGYYGWHIDHIKPLSWFKIDSIHSDSFKDCWKLENLAPKWAKDNLKKNCLFEG